MTDITDSPPFEAANKADDEAFLAFLNKPDLATALGLDIAITNPVVALETRVWQTFNKAKRELKSVAKAADFGIIRRTGLSNGS